MTGCAVDEEIMGWGDEKDLKILDSVSIALRTRGFLYLVEKKHVVMGISFALSDGRCRKVSALGGAFPLRHHASHAFLHTPDAASPQAR